MSHPNYDRVAALDPTNQQNAELAQLRAERDALRAERDVARNKLRDTQEAWDRCNAAHHADMDAARAELAALREQDAEEKSDLAEITSETAEMPFEDALTFALATHMRWPTKEQHRRIMAIISPVIRAMLAAERRKAIEEAVRICEQKYDQTGQMLRHAIRALAEPERGA
jgi:hypothetical protein